MVLDKGRTTKGGGEVMLCRVKGRRRGSIFLAETALSFHCLLCPNYSLMGCIRRKHAGFIWNPISHRDISFIHSSIT